MAENSYTLLLVDEPDPAAQMLWQYEGRFDVQAMSAQQTSAWLRRESADALAWKAGSPRPQVCDAVQTWKALRPQMQILVLLDSSPNTPSLVALMHAGCHDVLDRSSAGHIRDAAQALYERIDFVRVRSIERLRLKQSMEYTGFIGESPQMLQIYEQVRHAASLNSPVLLEGETGTGKGLVAHAIHALGARNGKPFVTVDCGCLAPTLVESELYGVTRGAFTGATADRVGLVQTARNGTLFLDEIGELPLEMQPKLLRLLEEGEVRRLGSAQSKPIDIRILSATSRDLDALVANRRFRLELYYRLNVLHIVLPPLRERPQDIPLLAAHFTSRHLFHGEPIAITESTRDVLMQYFWPGNVRELKNCIEAAIPTLTRNSIHVHNLPRRVTEAVATAEIGQQGSTVHLKDLEQRAIGKAMRLTHGDKTEAAKLLGIGKTTLYRKLKAMKARAKSNGEPAPEQPYLM
jgi:two-component system response regulator HydG